MSVCVGERAVVWHFSSPLCVHTENRRNEKYSHKVSRLSVVCPSQSIKVMSAAVVGLFCVFAAFVLGSMAICCGWKAAFVGSVEE